MSTSSETQREGRSKRRVRQWTAEDRARHRVLERERREAFNEQLMELASLLPELHGCSKTQLSKHVIVHECIEQLRKNTDVLKRMTEQISAIASERDALLSDNNQWRTLFGLSGVQPSGGHESIEELLTDGDIGISTPDVTVSPILHTPPSTDAMGPPDLHKLVTVPTYTTLAGSYTLPTHCARFGTGFSASYEQAGVIAKRQSSEHEPVDFTGGLASRSATALRSDTYLQHPVSPAFPFDA